MKNANDVATNILNQTSNGNFVESMTNGGLMSTVGSGTSIYTGEAKSAKELKEQKARQEFNKAYDRTQEEIELRVKKAEEQSKKSEKYLDMELMPINGYVLVRPFNENPFNRIEMTKSGIILTPNEGTFHNPDTGENDKEQKIEVVAEVVETPPGSKYCKPGDTIMYKVHSGVPIPFFNQGYAVVAESSILVIINENLTERLKEKE